MRCPFCHDNQDKVIDSRATEGGKAIRRRRQCLACGKRFTTFEHVEEHVKLSVIKRDRTRVPYDRSKVLGGAQKACYKRPVSIEQLNELVDSVEEELFRRGEREVESLEIGRMLAERLKRLDPVAYVRFVSVYLPMRTIDDLLAEAQQVKETHVPPPPPDQGTLFQAGEGG